MIRSVLIDPETCLRVWLKIICGPYLNRMYRFASPVGLWKVMVRVPVGCSAFFASIYCFSWSKISFRFFIQAFFCSFLTCVYHIYWIIIHWFWNLSSGFIENFQWDVYKPDIQICFPHRFVEGRGEGAGFFCFACLRQYIDCIQGISSSLNLFWWIFGDWFINIKDFCSCFWVSRYKNIT